ncbi:MAG: aminoacyl-tRNA hydrolase [Candidatus Nanohaloarchaea archaeon]
MSDIKQVIVVNSRLNMSRGKTAAQVAHASLKAVEKVSEDVKSEWEVKGSPKVVLSSGGRDMEDLYAEAERNNLSAHKVRDAGRTEIDEGSKTAVAIGPAKSGKIDQITGELQLLE